MHLMKGVQADQYRRGENFEVSIRANKLYTKAVDSYTEDVANAGVWHMGRIRDPSTVAI